MTFPELPDKVRILIARLSYSGLERVEIANWLVGTALDLENHPRVGRGNHLHKPYMGYPTPTVRNKILSEALQAKVHFVLMMDDDMYPDAHSPDRYVKTRHLIEMPDQKNFLPAALDFALEHPGPCVIGAPYCAGPPEERVLVSRFCEKMSDDPNGPAGGTLQLECFTREEAAERTGMELVSALPTGLMLIDMRCLSLLGPPWFAYEFANGRQDELISTEDTVFSRNLMFLGVPQYCAWQSWSAHCKTKYVGRPRRYPKAAYVSQVEDSWRKRFLEDQSKLRPADRENPKALSILRNFDDDPPVVPLTESAQEAEQGGEGG